MYRVFVRKNRTAVAILIFIILFTLIQYAKPAFLYKRDGSIRHFGAGFKAENHRTQLACGIIVGFSFLFIRIILFSNA